MTEQTVQPEGVNDGGDAKVVPVGESIRHRRRAQQAEKRAEQLEQQLREAQTQMQERMDELASAEAMRDELSDRLARVDQRRQIERRLAEYDVADVDGALTLLEKEAELGPEAEETQVEEAIQKLLMNRPYLRRQERQPLPGGTASGRVRVRPKAMLMETAERAARSGDRRDIAEYLRLRRQLSAK